MKRIILTAIGVVLGLAVLVYGYILIKEYLL